MFHVFNLCYFIPKRRAVMPHDTLHELVELAGGLTFIFLCLTSLIGLLKWKARITWLKPNYHFATAVLAVVFAVTHLLLMKLGR